MQHHLMHFALLEMKRVQVLQQTHLHVHVRDVPVASYKRCLWQWYVIVSHLERNWASKPTATSTDLSTTNPRLVQTRTQEHANYKSGGCVWT
eukprot:4936688-Amphidinium_carterae.1